MIRSVDEFVALLQSDDAAERRRTLTEDAPEAVWLALVSEHPDMRKWVALNKSVPLSVLRVLADDANPEVRWAVAERRRLDLDLFDKLSRDPDGSMRQRVAFNAKTPQEILQRLADDPWDRIAEVARERLTKADARRSPPR